MKKKDKAEIQKKVRLEWCKARRHLAHIERKMFSLAGIKIKVPRFAKRESK